MSSMCWWCASRAAWRRSPNPGGSRRVSRRPALRAALQLARTGACGLPRRQLAEWPASAVETQLWHGAASLLSRCCLAEKHERGAISSRGVLSSTDSHRNAFFTCSATRTRVKVTGRVFLGWARALALSRHVCHFELITAPAPSRSNCARATEPEQDRRENAGIGHVRRNSRPAAFRGFRSAPVLEAEGELWEQRLHWDYRASARLLMQYLDNHMLPGFAGARIRPGDGLRLLRLRRNQGSDRRCLRPARRRGRRRRRIGPGRIPKRRCSGISSSCCSTRRTSTGSSRNCFSIPPAHMLRPFAQPGSRSSAGSFWSSPWTGDGASRSGSARQPGITSMARGRPGAGRAAHLRGLPRSSRQPHQRSIPLRARLHALPQQHRSLCRLRHFSRRHRT